MTTPGFSSRSTSTSFRQFPMRDEAVMTEPGFSNSAPVKGAPEDTDGALAFAEHPADGFSNAAEVKVVEASTTESKTVKPRKAAAKKKA